MERYNELDLEKGEAATELEGLEKEEPATYVEHFEGGAPSTSHSELELLDPLLPTHSEFVQEPRRNERSERSTAFLTGLRGLAAFLVYMAHHIPWWYGNGALDTGFGYHGETHFATFPFIRSFFTGGSAAVAIFFVLSGYVLSISPLRMLRQSGQRARIPLYRSLLSASIRRPLRLFIPPAGVSLAFALIMHLPFGLAPHLQWPVPEPTVFAEMKAWVGEMWFVMNPFEKHGVFTRWFRYDPPAWTMAIEFEGSMLVFATMALFSLAAPKYRVWLFIITGLFLFATYQWAMSLFMAGVVLALNDLEGLDAALLAKRLSSRQKAITYNFIFFLGWWILSAPAGTKEPERAYNTPGWYYLTMIIPSNYFNDEYYRFWNSIGAVLLVYGVLKVRWLQALFNRPTLQYLGRISFSLYLVHIPFEWTVGDRIYRLFGRVRQEFTTPFDGLLTIPDVGPLGLTTGFLVAQIFILPLNLLLAEAGTRVLDEPSVKVGKWVVSRLGLSKDNSRHYR